MNHDQYIAGCQENNRQAQNALFGSFSPTALAICYRYLSDKDTAQDILIQAFVKIFNHIKEFKNEGSFEGWMKRIVINECLMELRRKKNFHLTLSLDDIHEEPVANFDHRLEYQEALHLLDELPTGYRTVFNLYAIEGYKHREIAEQLGISVNTSKSQLLLARKRLQELFKKKSNVQSA